MKCDPSDNNEDEQDRTHMRGVHYRLVGGRLLTRFEEEQCTRVITRGIGFTNPDLAVGWSGKVYVTDSKADGIVDRDRYCTCHVSPDMSRRK